MAWDERNLAHTVHAAGTRQVTLKCSTPRIKTDWTYLRLAREEPENAAGHLEDWAHEWDDHAGGLAGGRCVRCGRTLKEVRVRVNARTGEPVRSASRMAREIASTPADVPPVVFIERGAT